MCCIQVRDKLSGATYIVAESRLSQLPNKKIKTTEAKASAEKTNSSKAKDKKGSSNEKVADAEVPSCFDLLGKMSGASLVGMK